MGEKDGGTGGAEAGAGGPRRPELLAITYVFERRVAMHFALHRELPTLHPLVRETLATMCGEEGPHLRWVRERLDRISDRLGRDRVQQVVEGYEGIDADVYRREAQRFLDRGWELPAHVLPHLGLSPETA